MKKNFSIFVLIFLFIVSCSKETVNLEESNSTTEQPLTGKQINEVIEKISKEKTFYWKDATLHQLWSAVRLSENVVKVGFGVYHKEYTRENMPNADVVEKELFDLIAKNENQQIDDILIEKNDFFTSFSVKIKNSETLLALRNHKYVTWVNAPNYNPENFSNRNAKVAQFGCDKSSFALDGRSYYLRKGYYRFNKEMRVKVPWNYAYHSIENAWVNQIKSVSGKGITIGIIDTGVSLHQTQLNSLFSAYAQPSRFLKKVSKYRGFWPGTWHSHDDHCGHGTSMIAVAAGGPTPFYMPIGVAHDANIISVRVGDSVVIGNADNKQDVAEAFMFLAEEKSVKIISMSMGSIGTPGSIGVEDVDNAIWHAVNKKGKMVFLAAGTGRKLGYTGVVWPANLGYNNVFAVTGVKDDFTPCDECHFGKEVDFSVVMQMKKIPEITVPVSGYYDNTEKYVGGSSVATAMMAGMAALVWSKYPNESATDISNRLKRNSFRGIKSKVNQKHPTLGWGLLNVELALR